MSRKLKLDDITELRAYERERAGFQARVMELKRRRRVAVGPLITLTFENRETVRFQIQEMVRVERLADDARVQEELDTYNPLVPEQGELSATLFVELTSEDEMREWLPKLLGVERSVELRIGDGGATAVVRATPEADHAAQLTRETVTPSVHYIKFQLSDYQIERFASENVSVAVALPGYQEEAVLADDTKASLLENLHSDPRRAV